MLINIIKILKYLYINDLKHTFSVVVNHINLQSLKFNCPLQKKKKNNMLSYKRVIWDQSILILRH